jgi:hypothetical protein
LRGAAHARKYIHYAADVTTRLEAADPSPNIYNEMARDFVAQERAAGGPSIAPPLEQVLAVCMVFFCCTYTDIRTTLQVPIAQGAADVGFKRKAAEDNQIYDWQKDERAFQVIAKQYEKNETIGTKLIKGAEAAGIKAKGLAEAKGMFEIKKAEAFVMRTDANANAIKIEADANKIGAEAEIKKAEAEKIKAETALLEFELEQKRKATGNGTRAKQSETKATNVPVVPLAIYTKSNTTKPMTEQQKLNKRNKARQERLDAKAYREGLVSP